MWENTAPRSASFVPGSVCFSSALCLYVHGVGVHIVSESDVAQFHSIYSTALFLHQKAARLDVAQFTRDSTSGRLPARLYRSNGLRNIIIKITISSIFVCLFLC